MRPVLLLLSVALVSGCYQSSDTRIDSGARADGGTSSRDAASPLDAGPPVACDEETIPPYTGPPCSAAVSECRAACPRDDEPCRDACHDAECQRCIYATIVHCANEAGCEPLWRTAACCIETVPVCRGLRGLDRLTCASSCPMEFMPYQDCIEEMGGMECFVRAALDCDLR